MLRKRFNLLFLIMISFFIAILPGKALEVDINTIGETIDSVNSTTQSVYVIGSYVFTTNHKINTQDMMLAAKSIDLKDKVGKTNKDGVYGEMTIFKLSREYDSNDRPTGKWKVEKANFIGSSKFPATLEIRYVDYQKILDKYTITLKYNDEGVTPDGTLEATEGVVPTAPVNPKRKGYVFDGWYLDGELFEFDEPIEGDITLDAHWKEAVDFEELLDLGAKILDNENFSASFEEDVFNIQVKNKYRKIDDADLTGLVNLIDDLLQNDKVTSVVLDYNDTQYTFTSTTSEEEKESKITELLDALASTDSATLMSLMQINDDSDARFSSTLEKVFTISVTLKEGVSLTENSKTIYSVKFVSDAKDAEIETNLTDGFKGETSEFTVTVKANDYVNEKMNLKIQLTDGSYESLQHCETADNCTDWTGEKELTLEDKTYNFRVTWKTIGKIDYTISIVDAEDATITYAEATGSVTNKEKFNVTFDYADNTTPNKTEKVVSGDLVKEPEKPTRDHYNFVGWFNGEEEYTFEEPVTDNLNLKAHWEGKTYTAKFSGVSADEYPEQKVVYPNPVKKPETDPKQTGHTFTGWFVGDVEYTFEEPLTGNITINAVFDKEKYTVKFYSDNQISKEETVLYDGLATPPELVKKGYKIVKWTKDNVNGEEFDITKTTIKENVDLYANWEPIKYTVKFTGDDVSVDDQELEYPNKPQEPVEPKRNGYTFEGWFLGDANEKYKFDTEILEEGTITLTAHWKANTYHVTYVCNDCGRFYPSQDFTYPDKPSAPVDPIKNGYDFQYWYDEEDETQSAYNFTTTELLKDLTLVAKFETKKYDIFYELNLPDGVTDEMVTNKPADAKVQYNAKATKPDPAPSIEGYDFLGWYNKWPTVSATPFDFDNTVITKSYRLVAKWQKKAYTVTFEADGKAETINNVEYGRTINERLNDSDMKSFVLSPYKEGYRFDHWYLENDEEENEYSFDTPVKDNITLVAKFVPVVNIDNLVSNAALEIKNSSFLASYANGVVTVNVDDGEGEHDTAHNDEKIQTLVEADSASVAKTIKALVDDENIKSVNMSYNDKEYEFAGEESAIKTTLINLLTAIVEKNSSTYGEATLNELIENNYSDYPLTLTITLNDGVETVEGQSTSATYNVKVVSDVITVINEAELRAALTGNYESIKIGESFNVDNPVDISRSVDIFGKGNTITITNKDANTILNIRHNTIAGPTTVNIKDLTLKDGKKGIYVGEKTTTLSIMDVKFEGNTEMAMEIYGKLHANGTLSYDKEDYNHPFVRTPRSNVVTGGLATSAKETGNISIHDAYLDYEYEIIHKYADEKYTEDDFKFEWRDGEKVTLEGYCEACKDENGDLKQEYQELINTPYINHSDFAEKTSWTHYYLDVNHSQYYTVVFKDTPSAAIIWRYVLYNEKPVEPRDPLPTDYFKSFARERTVKVFKDGKVTEETVKYTLEGWSDDSKGTEKNYELGAIPAATKGRYYYTNYKKVE